MLSSLLSAACCLPLIVVGCQFAAVAVASVAVVVAVGLVHNFVVVCLFLLQVLTSLFGCSCGSCC